MDITTSFDNFDGVTSVTKYPNGNLKGCTLAKPNKIITQIGELIPQYEDGGDRRKHIRSLSFYDNGSIKSISLHNRQQVNTPLGILQAEFLSFHKNGQLKRLFPLNGKLTGFWSEEQEYQLAQSIKIKLPIGNINKKVIGIQFFDSGEVKSVTLWPNDVIKINTPVGNVVARIGISFYQNGKLKSFEPNEPTYFKTPIGRILAYDNNAVGIHGDTNSLVFNEDGSIKSLLTSTDQIEVTSKNGEKFIYKPELKPSLCDESIMEPYPVRITFAGNRIGFYDNIKHEYDIDEYKFEVVNNYYKNKSCGNSCNSCSLGGCS